MIMKEQDNNTFTKQKTEVERYLMRIVQRYFETENNYSNASIESIIVESITRFKRYCKDKGKDFLFSFNRKTGHLAINIHSFGGEPAFEKNTAFNKDFGEDPDTICRGDDPRLSDDRDPYEHSHEILDVPGLSDLLKQFDIPNAVPGHYNKDLLDILTYTGQSLEIDLAIIEQIRKQLPMFEVNSSSIKAELQTYSKNKEDDLNSSVYALKTYVDSLAQNIIIGFQWVDEGKKSIQNGIKNLNDYCLQKFKNLVSMAEYNRINITISQMYKEIGTDSFNIEMTIDGIRNVTIDGSPYVVYNIVSQSFTLPASAVDNHVKYRFKYTNANGREVEQSLPFWFKDKEGNDVVIQCGTEGSNVSCTIVTTARYAGIGAHNTAYNGGESFIVATRNNKKDMVTAYEEIEPKGYMYIKYDKDNPVQQSMIASITGSEAFYIGASTENDEGYYFNIDNTTCSFTKDDIITDSGRAVYYQNGGLHTCMHIEEKDQLVEIPFPRLSDYFKNPQIRYEIFKEGEE